MKLLENAANPLFWQEVRNNRYYQPFIKNLFSLWDRLCENRDIPDLPYSKYTLFFTTGDRTVYEKPYFERRRILNVSAMLSLIFPEEKKYFTKLEDAIFSICTEYTWCLPAHVYAHGHGALEPDVVDLFASQTGFSLAEIYVLLGDRLDGVITKLMLSEIERRTVDATISNADKWWWESITNNWSAICSGCLGCIAMLLYPEKLSLLKPRIDSAMEYYISGFLGEGMCVEGLSYWDYGFGFFTVYADMLRDFTDGKENYFIRPEIKAIAAFPSRVMLTGNVVVSFSDASMTASLSRGIIHYLRDIYGGEVRLPSDEYCIDNSDSDRFAYMLRSVLWCDKPYTENDETPNPEKYFYAEKCQWYVNKSSQYSFAAKGGHNNESHNHNDIGSFIFAYDGRQIFADLGSGLYTKDYFTSKRYESFEPSSESHSVPIIDGRGQLPGECRRGSGAEAGEAFFSLNIAEAYGDDRILSIRRSFDLSDSSVRLTDTFDFTTDMPITERLVTLSLPTVRGREISVDGVTARFGEEVCEVEITKRRVHRGECYLIDLKLCGGARSFGLEIEKNG